MRILILALVLLPSLSFSDHDLREIERRCEIYRYDDQYGELDCSRNVSDRRSLQRKCSAYIYEFPYGEIECSGSHFRDVERKCEVYMYDSDYGEIDC